MRIRPADEAQPRVAVIDGQIVPERTVLARGCITRAEAKVRGEKFYWPENPCPHGHYCQRYTSNRACFECSKIQSAQWYSDPKNEEKRKAKFKRWADNNREYNQARFAKWRRENPELERQITLDWRRRNSDRFKAKNREWSQNNPEKRRQYLRDYRGRKYANGGHHTARDVLEIYEMQRGRCACCRVPLKGNYHVDHIVALVNGGRNDRRNLQILCQSCNNQKAAKCPIDFMRSKGRLL